MLPTLSNRNMRAELLRQLDQAGIKLSDPRKVPPTQAGVRQRPVTRSQTAGIQPQQEQQAPSHELPVSTPVSIRSTPAEEHNMDTLKPDLENEQEKKRRQNIKEFVTPLLSPLHEQQVGAQPQHVGKESNMQGTEQMQHQNDAAEDMQQPTAAQGDKNYYDPDQQKFHKHIEDSLEWVQGVAGKLLEHSRKNTKGNTINKLWTAIQSRKVNPESSVQTSSTENNSQANSNKIHPYIIKNYYSKLVIRMLETIVKNSENLPKPKSSHITASASLPDQERKQESAMQNSSQETSESSSTFKPMRIDSVCQKHVIDYLNEKNVLSNHESSILQSVSISGQDLNQECPMQTSSSMENNSQVNVNPIQQEDIKQLCRMHVNEFLEEHLKEKIDLFLIHEKQQQEQRDLQRRHQSQKQPRRRRSESHDSSSQSDCGSRQHRSRSWQRDHNSHREHHRHHRDVNTSRHHSPHASSTRRWSSRSGNHPRRAFECHARSRDRTLRTGNYHPRSRDHRRRAGDYERRSEDRTSRSIDRQQRGPNPRQREPEEDLRIRFNPNCGQRMVSSYFDF